MSDRTSNHLVAGHMEHRDMCPVGGWIGKGIRRRPNETRRASMYPLQDDSASWPHVLPVKPLEGAGSSSSLGDGSAASEPRSPSESAGSYRNPGLSRNFTDFLKKTAKSLQI